jgi:hypothetical protein
MIQQLLISIQHDPRTYRTLQTEWFLRVCLEIGGAESYSFLGKFVPVAVAVFVIVVSEISAKQTRTLAAEMVCG